MRIYIDIDDVVTETARMLCVFADELFGRKVAYENVFAFDVRDSFSLDDAQTARLMSRAHSEEALASYPETPGASATIISWMAAGHDITFVTGRPAMTHEGTCRWLEAHGLGGIPVIHVDKFGRELAAMFKSCDYVVTLDDFLAMRFDFAVEDSPIGLGHLARIPGCRVAVFNRPWNAKTAMPSDAFHRCADWREVDELMNETCELISEEPRPRTALADDLRAELMQRALDPSDCIRLTLSRHQGLGPAKESVRPVAMGGATVWQRERTQGKQIVVRNFAAGAEAEGAIAELLDATGAREYHLAAAKGDLHVRITRKGRALVSRGKAQGAAAAAPAPHDRAKDTPLSRFDSAALLRIIGLADASGAIRASMRGKYDQINAFLAEVDALLADNAPDAARTFRILDCGCGRAYLTLSVCRYLQCVHGMDVAVCGVDRNESVIATCREMAASLDMARAAEFVAADLADFAPQGRPDLVLSLHACDTATDLAIATGIRLGAPLMLIAPCYQHDLQKQLKTDGPSRALMRHSILRERFADILTDAFRAQILRVCGYRTRVAEFVSPEATARNIILRAAKGLKPGQAQAVAEYLDMKDEWRVSPALETILGERLTKFFGRVETAR